VKVLLTGGTGFVGNYVAEKLLEAGHAVRALARKGSESKLRAASKCEIVNGDVTIPKSVEVAVRGCDAVIHLVGIIRDFPSKDVTFRRMHLESTQNVAKAAVGAGVKRFVHMSANGARHNAPTAYWSTKWAAEEYLRTLNLDLTVFRPSTIIGTGGEFVGLLKQMASLPVTPVIGNGKYKMQPVAVWNISEFFVRALGETRTIGKVYEVGGPQVLTYNVMLRVAGELLGKKVTLAHLPAFPIELTSTIMDRFAFWPVTRTQLKMLSEDNVCDNSGILADMPTELISYREALSRAFGKQNSQHIPSQAEPKT